MESNEFNESVTAAYDYDYDITASLATFDWSELIPAVVVYAVLLFLGICGNALIIFTISKYRRLKTITNIFLASLATADLLLVLVCIPVNVAKLFSYTWTFGVFLCKFVHYVQNVSAICSVLTLTAMSIERYYAIVHPMRAKSLCTLSQARKVIGSTWVASVTLAAPILWIQIQLPVGERIPAFWCVRDWNNVLGWQIYELYMLVIVLVLPCTIMVAAYGAIACEIWRVTAIRETILREQQREPTVTELALQRNAPDEEHKLQGPQQRESKWSGRSLTRSQADHRTAKQVVKMLVAIVVLFAICWAPFLIDNVLTAFAVLPSARMGPVKHMRIVFHFLAYSNSCLNPIVYGFMSRNFRRGFKSALRLNRNCFCCNRKSRKSKPEAFRCSHFSRTSNAPTASVRFNEPKSVGTTTASVVLTQSGPAKM